MTARKIGASVLAISWLAVSAGAETALAARTESNADDTAVDEAAASGTWIDGGRQIEASGAHRVAVGPESAEVVPGPHDLKHSSHDVKTNVIAQLRTSGPGLYRVLYEDVIREGSGVRTNELRLSRRGEAVAYYLEPAARQFRPGSAMYFVNDDTEPTPSGSETVYELELSGAREIMPLLAAPPSGPTRATYRHRDEWEEDRVYEAALSDAPDRWLWDVVRSPERKSYVFSVEGLASSGRSRLTVHVQGVSEFLGAPDHHVRIYVNGVWVTDDRWDGKRARRIEAELEPGTLRDGDNVIELENVDDTEAPYSKVMLDRFALEYPKVGYDGGPQADGRWTAPGTAELHGFSPGTIVLDTSDDVPCWIGGADVDVNGVLRFRVEANRFYLAVSPESIQRPQITIPSAARLILSRQRSD